MYSSQPPRAVARPCCTLLTTPNRKSRQEQDGALRILLDMLVLDLKALLCVGYRHRKAPRQEGQPYRPQERGPVPALAGQGMQRRPGRQNRRLIYLAS